MSKLKTSLRALRAAFPHTIPILTGFAFLGVTYGIYMSTQGFSFLYPMFMSLLIFGGSLEFVAVTLLLGAFDPIQTLAVSLMLQARHIFYGISMLEKYRGTGLKKIYLIFGLCDESFSINYTAKIPDNVDRGWFMFWITALNQTYWVVSATIGGIAGSLITFNTGGIEFVMTAMFVVIFLEQFLKERNLYTAGFGFAASVLSLLIFGRDSFLIPAMIAITLALTLFRHPIERFCEKHKANEKGDNLQ